MVTLSALYAVTKKLSVGPGVDVTSGNDGTDPAGKYKRFDPLYGTPHKFWGYMDYFYAADGFGANGLVDVYLKSRFRLNSAFTCMADVHRFALPDPVRSESGARLDRYLGTEIDLTAQYTLTQAIAVEGGYSAMVSSETMTSSKVKNVTNPDRSSHWAYIMISIKPEWNAGKP
jgi:hypothetical protein